jgi:hypothetical protein
MAYVCAECLADEDLGRIVAQHGESVPCDYCGESDSEKSAVSLDTVIEHMRRCIERRYIDPVDELSYDSAEGGYQGSVIDASDLLVEIAFSPDCHELLLDVQEAFSDHDWCDQYHAILSPSERHHNGWVRFELAVTHQRRFTFWSMDDQPQEKGLPDYLPVKKMLAEMGEVIQQSKLIKTVDPRTRFHRVRVHDAATAIKTAHDLSSPPIDRAIQSNRMSPAGIPMFYGAVDFETACIETIDFKDDNQKRVTGGSFEAARALKILDLAEMPPVPGFFDLNRADERETLIFLHTFAQRLVKPISRGGMEHIEYVPTQVFAEYLRFGFHLGDGKSLDGIRYKSSRNNRPCVVLFLDQEDCTLGREWPKTPPTLKFVPASIRTEFIDDKLQAMIQAEKSSAGFLFAID